MNTIEQLKFAFQPVPRLDPGQTQRVMKIAIAAQVLAEELLDLAPECADRTHAIRLILDAKFWAVQAITHHAPAKTENTPKPVVQAVKAKEA